MYQDYGIGASQIRLSEMNHQKQHKQKFIYNKRTLC